jgi:hypothetical protein
MTGDYTPSTSTSHPSVVSVSDPDYLLIQHLVLAGDHFSNFVKGRALDINHSRNVAKFIHDEIL